MQYSHFDVNNLIQACFLQVRGSSPFHPPPDSRSTHAATKERYEFIDATGYIHCNFAFPGEFGTAETPIPGGFPQYDPAGGGDPSLVGIPDHNDGGVHLTSAGRVAYIERGFEEFCRAWLREN